MRGVVALGTHLLGLGADVEPGRAVRAPQPYAADLVGVDIAQRLLVQYVLEVCSGIARVEDCCCGNGAHARAVLRVSLRISSLAKGTHQEGKKRPRALERNMHRPVKLEEDVSRVMHAVAPQFTDRAQVVRDRLGRAVGALEPPAHDPLVAVGTARVVIQSVPDSDDWRTRARCRPSLNPSDASTASDTAAKGRRVHRLSIDGGR